MSEKMFSLEGKVALVTGAAYGIGYAMAKALAKAGAKIAFNCRGEKSGPCRICSVDNGSKQNVYAYQGKKIETYQGRAMLVIQADKPGIIEVTAECGNVISNKVTINVK